MLGGATRLALLGGEFVGQNALGGPRELLRRSRDRVGRPHELAWGRPRHELLLLALVAVAVLLPVYGIDQDGSRLCLTQAVVQGALDNDSCLSRSGDRASFGGHLYTDKAPGMSLLELPAMEAVRLPARPAWPEYSLRLWGIRLLSSGVAFLVCALLVGRVTEGLAPGYGALSLVTFGLGTLVAPFAAANFDHVPAAALGFGAFLLAWRQKPLLAGLVAGIAVTVEYEMAAVLLIVAAYVALRGRTHLGRYLLAALPGIALLATYDWSAFGAPSHLSYRYVTKQFGQHQASGFFGIGIPHPNSVYVMLAGTSGLLLISPVLVTAALGLASFGRRYQAEALVCVSIVLVFLIVDSGYFDPYGGTYAGPRFLIPMLPFLAIGLGPAYARFPRTTALLAACSIVGTIGLTLTWASPHLGKQHSIWAILISSRFEHLIVPTVLHWVSPDRILGAVAVALFAAAAFSLALMMRHGGPSKRLEASGS